VTRRLRSLRALAVLASAGALVAVPALAATAAPTISGSGTGTVITSEPAFADGVGTDPQALAATSSALYTADYTAGKIGVASLSGTFSTSITLPVGAEPEAESLSPDGSRLYVSSQGTHEVSVIDTSTNTIVDHFALTHGSPAVNIDVVSTTLSPDGSVLYVIDNSSQKLYAFDVATHALLASQVSNVYTTGSQVRVSPDGATVYVTFESPVPPSTTGGLLILNASDLTEISHVDLSNASGLALSPDGSHVYVAGSTGANGVITELDADGMATSRSAAAGFAVNHLVVSPDGGVIYAADSSNAFLSTVTTSDFTAQKSTPPGYGAVGAARDFIQSPDGLHLYSAGGSSEVVHPFSVARLTVTAPATAAVGSGNTNFIAQLAAGSGPVPDYSADTVTVDILHGVTVVATGSGSPNASTGLVTVPIDLAGLPLGTYSVRATFSGPDGEIVATATGLQIVSASALAATGIDARGVLIAATFALFAGAAGVLLVSIRRERRES